MPGTGGGVGCAKGGKAAWQVEGPRYRRRRPTYGAELTGFEAQRAAREQAWRRSP